MARPKSTTLTDRESEIMDALWSMGSATSEQIRAKLSGNPHDSTVRTLLRVLVAKNHVVADSESRPTIYRPTMRRKTVQKKIVRNLLKRFFGGSPKDLVMQLLDDERLTPDQLKAIEEEYRQRSKRRELP